MSPQPLESTELDAKVRQYRSFVDDVLKSNLQQTVEQRSKHVAELEEWQQLRNSILQLQQDGTQQLKTLVELGAGVRCKALVPDCTRVCISIGLGFHLECTLEEAGRVIALREAALQSRVDEGIAKAAQLRAQIAFAAQAIEKLAELSLAETPDTPRMHNALDSIAE